MHLAISSIIRAFGQLADPAILRVLAKSFAITLGVFVAFAWAIVQSLPWLLGEYLDLEGDAYIVIGTLIAVLSAWFLFRVVALAVLQFFADEVVTAVEARHYPDAANRTRKLPFREDLGNSLRGIGRTLGFNALALPLAIVLFFTAIGPAIVFLLVNAVLLGRELTDMGWLRHRASPQDSTPVGPFERLALGGAVAGLMLIPFVNILAPVIGAAAGTHMVQKKMKNNHD
ncbi:EI24 domain-containing protein [Altererythrobacter lutimaris]|uniref:EI24 domain-containing protein n=1 Tax=Altererythrobacter lutimaris TaxID=2743979 RepID=A0A850HD96_9SPHN|nr:EI24 domain-containing protein [Altererythrobacter lutimaris]NVE95345.1 EI24 domain-containing protein [Altererythrobacter lutimaris]